MKALLEGEEKEEAEGEKVEGEKEEGKKGEMTDKLRETIREDMVDGGYVRGGLKPANVQSKYEINLQKFEDILARGMIFYLKIFRIELFFFYNSINPPPFSPSFSLQRVGMKQGQPLLIGKQ